ncbi:MAG: hypothetical protein KatS3mg033_1072 [Thermonema sp.]|jgi:hypothetical protein|uniref:DUF2905 domain-containing protein n=1 Tax=Thermonema TaxID=28194 RepID=UPI00056FB64B|nr:MULTISPECIES: DUF2905 domain-containing protein [Thermonema]GIV39272.1 MAG: hypothetical protein KatS3mg033_1072 [Thermonema sp.]
MQDTPNIGKWLMLVGGSLFLLGLLWWAAGRFFSFGKLPGDIIIKRENFTFYFPLASSLLLSLLLSLVLWLIGRMR